MQDFAIPPHYFKSTSIMKLVLLPISKKTIFISLMKVKINIELISCFTIVCETANVDEIFHILDEVKKKIY